MGNINKTKLECNDPMKFWRIMRSMHFIRSEVDLSGIWDGYVHIETTSGTPHRELLELSKEYPALILIARYLLESENWDIVHIVRYVNGSSVEIGFEDYSQDIIIP